jgi:hypothetical protein
MTGDMRLRAVSVSAQSQSTGSYDLIARGRATALPAMPTMPAVMAPPITVPTMPAVIGVAPVASVNPVAAIISTNVAHILNILLNTLRVARRCDTAIETLYRHSRCRLRCETQSAQRETSGESHRDPTAHIFLQQLQIPRPSRSHNAPERWLKGINSSAHAPYAATRRRQ